MEGFVYLYVVDIEIFMIILQRGGNSFPAVKFLMGKPLFFSLDSQRDCIIAVWTFYFYQILIPPWIFSTKLHRIKVGKDIMIKKATEST